jgi:hypothetical protein
MYQSKIPLSWTSEAQKSFLNECRAKNYDSKMKKSFLRERSVSFLLKSRF